MVQGGKALMTVAALMLGSMLNVTADKADEDKNATPPKRNEVSPPQVEPSSAYPRRVYGKNVEDIGLIIGGASEDAKAKVRRLPVQD